MFLCFLVGAWRHVCCALHVWQVMARLCSDSQTIYSFDLIYGVVQDASPQVLVLFQAAPPDLSVKTDVRLLISCIRSPYMHTTLYIYLLTLPPANCDIPRATSEILDLEQLIFDTAIALDDSSQWAQLVSRLQRVSRDLLQHARELPESKISTKALPRKLRRHEVFHQAKGRLPEKEKDELGGMPRAPRIQMWNYGKWE